MTFIKICLIKGMLQKRITHNVIPLKVIPKESAKIRGASAPPRDERPVIMENSFDMIHMQRAQQADII